LQLNKSIVLFILSKWSEIRNWSLGISYGDTKMETLKYLIS